MRIRNKKQETKNKKMGQQRGFTLLELLTVMAVIIIVGTIMGSILFTTLRGAARTEAIASIKRNGDYAISQMAKTIRNAHGFSYVTTPTNTQVTSCLVTSSSAPLTRYRSVTVRDANSNLLTFECDIGTRSVASISGTSARIPLMNTNAVEYVDNSCYFTCSQLNTADPPAIGIHFLLQQKNTRFFEDQSSLQFDTTVFMRNLNQISN